jgi:hypothetical protein
MRAAIRMILRQYLEQLHHRHERPAVGARPVNAGCGIHALDPGVHEQAPFFHEHAIRELQDLARRVVVVAPFTRELAGLCEARDAHVKIVEPQRVRQRAIPRQRAVLQAELARRHVLHVVVDPRSKLFATEAREVGLDQRRAHRTGIVERAREQDAAESRGHASAA